MVAVCAAVVAVFYWRRAHSTWNAPEMVASLPQREAVLVYLDVAALRSSGVLSMITGSKAVEDLDYQDFVTKSGFDYRSDLDRVAISFIGADRFIVAAGRFDWPKLQAYAQSKGAVCLNAFCDVKGSQIDTKVSFFPLHTSVIAVATTRGIAGGAYAIGPKRNQPVNTIWPTGPAWIWTPSSMWKNAGDLPTGLRMFGRALDGTERTIFTVEPEGNRLSLTLDILCTSVAEAGKLKTQLEDATGLLNKMLVRDNLKPGPRDLGGLLASGTFRSEDRRVYGKWPVELAFLRALMEGEIE